MSHGKSFLIQLHSVQQGSDLEAGVVFPTMSDQVVIGRGNDCDVILADPSVSTRHAWLEATPEGFVLRNLTRNGTTFVNQSPVGRGDEVQVTDRTIWLQVGCALLKVVTVADTIPVSKALPLPAPVAVDPQHTPLLRIKAGPRSVRIKLNGKPVSLFPSAARALARLAATPGEVVDQDELLTAMDEDFAERAGGLNLNQTMTYVRRLFIEGLESGEVDATQLRGLVQSCPAWSGPPLAEDLTDKALCRELVANVRGVGYVLMLPPQAVHTERK